MNLVGPLQTAVIDNTSPVWAILFGMLLLGQLLSPKQIIGAIIVIVGALSVQLLQAKPVGKPS